MDGIQVRKVRKLHVKREFKGGRLERQMLATAYETAVPPVSAAIRPVADRHAAQRKKPAEITMAQGA